MEASALICLCALGRDGVIENGVVGDVLEETGMLLLRGGTSCGCASG